MSKHLTRKSDSQANAEALARRSSTYADEHARSWRLRMDRPSAEPKTLAGYVRELRDEWRNETAVTIHSHDLDSGGTPEFTGSFFYLLDGKPSGIDRADGETFRLPFRACFDRMAVGDARSKSAKAIAFRVVAGGENAIEAVLAEGAASPEWAEIVAFEALARVWRNLSPITIPLPKSRSAA